MSIKQQTVAAVTRRTLNAMRFSTLLEIAERNDIELPKSISKEALVGRILRGLQS